MNIVMCLERKVSQVVFPGQQIWNFLVAGLLKHMSTIRDSDFLGY
jgi:hypothetical protein